MRKVIIKAVSMIWAVLMFLSVFLIPASAVAAPYVNPADDTYVVNDLKTMGFNPADFPTDPSADFVQVIHFLEYGYDAGGKQNFYSLYLYLYNPSGKAIDIEGSYLELSYYDVNLQGMSKVAKYPLTVEGRSIDEFDENVFYKFKVGGARSFVKNLDKIRREYQLSAVEIKYEDSDERENLILKDPKTGKSSSYVYTGYQYNFGSNNPKGSLYYRVEEFDTIPVEVIPLTWFSDTSNLGEDYRWEVKSYAFNIPTSYIRKYGDILGDFKDDPENKKHQTSGLWTVSGEYYKYAVNGLIVPDQTWYDRFDKMTGLDGTDEEYPFFIDKSSQISNSFNPLDFNFRLVYSFSNNYYDRQQSDNIINRLLLLSKGNNASISTSDFLKLWSEKGEPKFTKNSRVPMIGDHVYNVGEKIDYDISVDGADLSTALITHAQGVNAAGTSTFNKWLDKLFNKGLYTDETGYVDCKPIVELNAMDVSVLKTNEAIGKALYISNDNVSEVRDFYNDYAAMGLNKVYIVRTGVEPYYCSDCLMYNNFVDIPSTGHYYEKVIHTDFDILSFTFRNSKGAMQTVPVDCKPVDNLGGVVDGNNTQNNNPNNYPDTPSGLGGIVDYVKQAWEILQRFLKWLDQFKTAFIVLVAFIGSVAIFALVCIFWKWLKPIFQRIGEVVGPVFRGAGNFFKAAFHGVGMVFSSMLQGLGFFFKGLFKVLGFLFKLAFYPLIFLWNVGVMIVSIWFAPAQVLKIPMKLNIGGDSSDARYYYEDRKYKQSEERRKQEKHEAEMAKHRAESSKPPENSNPSEQ